MKTPKIVYYLCLVLYLWFNYIQLEGVMLDFAKMAAPLR